MAHLLRTCGVRGPHYSIVRGTILGRFLCHADFHAEAQGTQRSLASRQRERPEVFLSKARRRERGLFMSKFNWLLQNRFESLIRREHDWVFTFEPDSVLAVECLWRLIENQKITRTSEDHGQQFGLPAPIDAAVDLTRLLANLAINKVELNENTLDLRIILEGDIVIEVIPDSAGYESWNLQQGKQQWIAQGGGNLVEYKTE
jgi:hypothetical protein